MRTYRRDRDEYLTRRALELSTIFSESRIAQILSEELGEEITRNTVHGRIYRRTRSSGLECKPRTSMPYFERYERYLRKVEPPPEKANFSFDKGHIKILVINDLHAPFQHEEALQTALTDNFSSDIIVTSEISDLYSYSPFAKDKHVSFELEVEEILRLFEYFNQTFPVTFVVSAGHEKRITRAITRKIHTELLFLIETNLLELLASPFPNIITIPEPYFQINDALFTHLNKYSQTIPMRSAHNTHRWIQNWKKSLGIGEYRVLAQAHSHHSGIYNMPTVQLIETGCLQKIPEWVLDRCPMLPWMTGWTVIEQNDGRTDLNATKVVIYEDRRVGTKG